MQFKHRLAQTYKGLFDQVDGASLIVFRVLFGLIMAWEVVRYFQKGRIYRNYIMPEFHFKYYGFEWVAPLPGDGMYWLFAFLGVLAMCIAVGAFYRLASTLFFLCFAYIFFIDQTTYLNHFYLVGLFACLMIFMPANRSFSIDAWRRPELRSRTVPSWSVWTLRSQMEIMLLYAGIVKINADWLQLQPLTMWLQARTDTFLIGPLYSYDWFVAVGAYGAIILHVVGAPLLLWRKTRLFVFFAYCCFHISNHFTFNIGIFPWFTIVGTLLFFDPGWPRQFGQWILRMLPGDLSRTLAWPASIKDFLKAPDGKPGNPSQQFRFVVVSGIAIWMSAQVLVPARHLLYPGNPSWTEQGHRFAWQMKLRSKRGRAKFIVRDPATGRTWRVDDRAFLTARQIRKMSGRPDMLLQYAHHLATQWQTRHGVANAEVRVQSSISLNGRRKQFLIDPHRDLAKVERNLRSADWILPLREPLNGGKPLQARIGNSG